MVLLRGIRRPEGKGSRTKTCLKGSGRAASGKFSNSPVRLALDILKAASSSQVWQDRLPPIRKQDFASPWKRIGGGYQLNRKMDDLIEQKNLYLPGPLPMTYTYKSFRSNVSPAGSSKIVR